MFMKRCSLILLLGCSPAWISAFSATTTGKWKPKIADLEERKQQFRDQRGADHHSETIGSVGFHHVEFYCGDAKSTAFRFALGLGMRIVGSTGQHTGNDQCVSYGLESGDVRFLLTAPYSTVMSSVEAAAAGDGTTPDEAPLPLPNYSPSDAHDFFARHGLAARAIGIQVKDAASSFRAAVEKGANPVLEPTFVPTCPGQTEKGQTLDGCQMAEVTLYGDVVLRFVSFSDNDEVTNENGAVSSSSTPTRMPFLPHLSPMQGKMAERKTFGIHRIDHAVGNVPDLLETLTHVSTFTGFHEFACFTPEDVGTIDSGLNSVVLASDSEDVLLPLNEPTEGKRKSQIQTYLEQNEGAGLQHLALKTSDIFSTIELMRQAEEEMGGFELMKKPSDQYYLELPERLGDQLTEAQYKRVEELGILADADDEGILLQLFTKPIGDRPTFFFEIIQRIGCAYKPKDSEIELERPGCGGFGQGNFRELFRSIEEHEKTLKV